MPETTKRSVKKNEAENRANNVILQNDLRNMLYSEMGSVHWLVDLSEIKFQFCSEGGSRHFVAPEDASMISL